MKCYRECPLFDERERMVQEKVEDAQESGVIAVIFNKVQNTCSFYRDKECKLAEAIEFIHIPEWHRFDRQTLTPYEEE